MCYLRIEMNKSKFEYGSVKYMITATMYPSSQDMVNQLLTSIFQFFFITDMVTDLVLVTCSNVTSGSMVLFHCRPT